MKRKEILLLVSVLLLCSVSLTIIIIGSIFLARRHQAVLASRIDLSEYRNFVDAFHGPTSLVSGICVIIEGAVPPIEIEVRGHVEASELQVVASWMVSGSAKILPRTVSARIVHMDSRESIQVKLSPATEAFSLVNQPIEWRVHPRSTTHPRIPPRMILLSCASNRSFDAHDHRAMQSFREWNGHATMEVRTLQEGRMLLANSEPDTIAAFTALLDAREWEGARLLLALFLLLRKGGIVMDRGVQCNAHLWSGASAHLDSAASLVVVRDSTSMDLSKLRQGLIAAEPNCALVRYMLIKCINSAPEPKQLGRLLNMYAERPPSEPHILGLKPCRREGEPVMYVSVLESTFSGDITDRAGVLLANTASIEG
jgi:hypothetical protein